MNIEIAWLMPFITALLWQAGGTWQKQIRRLGVPTLFTLTYWYFWGWAWWLLLLWPSVWGVLTLPFTFKGDSIHNSWFNWLWIWIAGYLIGVPVLIPAFFKGSLILGFLLPLIPMVVQGIMGTLSNIKATAKWFPWKLVEGCIGLAVAIPHCYVLAFLL